MVFKPRSPNAMPPPLENTLREGLAFPGLLANPFRMPRRGRKVGHGRPVLVIPGLATGDISTLLLRRTLATRGFEARGWQMGINQGASLRKLAELEEKLAAIHEKSGEKAILIGWSLGGLYARVLGHRVPDHIAMVITVGSPFSGDRHSNIGWRIYEMINDHSVTNPPFAEDFSIKPPVPTVAIWSEADGVVAGHSARGLEGETDCTIEVAAQHFALASDYDCIERVIDAIALGDGVSQMKA